MMTIIEKHPSTAAGVIATALAAMLFAPFIFIDGAGVWVWAAQTIGTGIGTWLGNIIVRKLS